MSILVLATLPALLSICLPVYLPLDLSVYPSVCLNCLGLPDTSRTMVILFQEMLSLCSACSVYPQKVENGANGQLHVNCQFHRLPYL